MQVGTSETILKWTGLLVAPRLDSLALGLQEFEQVRIDLVRINSAHPV
jgi:hypothetical protein